MNRYVFRLSSFILCLLTILFLNSPINSKAADDWDVFYTYFVGNGGLDPYGMPVFQGFDQLYNSYLNAISGPNQHDGSSQEAQRYLQMASRTGWLAMASLYTATKNQAYGYEQFDGIVMKFFNEVYAKVPSKFSTSQGGQVPNGTGGYEPSGNSEEQTDSNPRYMFGGTLSTLETNSDCSININSDTSTEELGLALRYQTLNIIYTAIVQHFFSPPISTKEETMAALGGNLSREFADTPQAQVFQNSVLPYLEMVMQDPFCKINADFARSIICVAVRSGILDKGSVDIDCSATSEPAETLGCTPPPLF